MCLSPFDLFSCSLVTSDDFATGTANCIIRISEQVSKSSRSVGGYICQQILLFSADISSRWTPFFSS